jgi:hypothetical protein
MGQRNESSRIVAARGWDRREFCARLVRLWPGASGRKRRGPLQDDGGESAPGHGSHGQQETLDGKPG